MKSLLVAMFLSVGGLSLLFALAGKLAPDLTARGLTWLFGKFPKLKDAVHSNLAAIEALEDAELAAIKKVEEQA